MLFQTFLSQEERRGFGGSYFIEMQYCRLPQGTDLKTIVSVDAIGHWENDSLYIYGDDDNKFASLYGNIFIGGTYNNLKCGMLDLVGINYYSPEQTHLILEQVKKTRPPDHQTLLNWLEKAKGTNGFYILGI